MNLGLIALIISFISIIIMLVLMISTSKKINKLTAAQLELMQGKNDSADDYDVQDIVDRVSQKMLDEGIVSDPVTTNLIVDDSVEDFDDEKFETTETEVAIEDFEPIDLSTSEAELAHDDTRTMKIPTLDKAKTDSLLSSFAKKPVEKEEELDIVDTQEIGAIYDNLDVEVFDELPQFDEIEPRSQEDVDRKAIETKLKSIRDDFDNKVVLIRNEIDKLTSIENIEEREAKKRVLKAELLDLKQQIVEFQQLEKEVKDMVN